MHRYLVELQRLLQLLGQPLGMYMGIDFAEGIWALQQYFSPPHLIRFVVSMPKDIILRFYWRCRGSNIACQLASDSYILF